MSLHFVASFLSAASAFKNQKKRFILYAIWQVAESRESEVRVRQGMKAPISYDFCKVISIIVMD